MRPAFQVRVECYAGYKADERPLRFYIEDRQFDVVELLDRWYGPGDTWFRVRADDDNLYVLRHTETDTWTLESFRRSTREKL
ncbi:MAG TPA: hypothetical protein VLE22_11295 [Bryobacteraceae bacterium]|nr:hypothetical protein [Bryobacteraceae bacterium]